MACYTAQNELMRQYAWCQVEAFKPGECGHQDMWPCPAKGSRLAGPVIPWNKVGDQIERIHELPPPSYS